MQEFHERPEIVVGGIEGEMPPTEQMGMQTGSYIDDIRDAISELGLAPADVKIEDTSYGYGADALGVAVVLAGVFLAGKKIEENLDAWIRLAKRIPAAIECLRPRQRSVYLSEPVAAVLALNKLLERHPEVGDLKLVSSYRAIVENPSMSRKALAMFRYQPDRHYVFVFEIPGLAAHIIAIRSDGKTEFHHVLEIGDWQLFHGLVTEAESAANRAIYRQIIDNR